VENVKYKVILLIIFLSLLQNITLFTDNITGWDAVYHMGQTKIIYNEGTTSFRSPICFGIPFYNESPLVFYFTAYFARIFHLNIDLVIKYIPLSFTFTTLIALYYFFKLFLKSENQVYLGLIIFSLITLPTYYAPCRFLLFVILSLYFTYTAKNIISYLLIGITMGISFLIYAPIAFVLSFVIFILIVYKHLGNIRQMLKALAIVGSVYFLIISITIVPTYYRGTLSGVPTEDSISSNIKNEIEITIPNIGIGEDLNTHYLRKIRIPNIFFFYQGCVGLFLLSLFGIYKKRKEVISLIIPLILLLLIGNIKYFHNKPFSCLIFFSIPLAVMGVFSFRYKKALTVIFISYLFLFTSKNFYLFMNYGPQEEKYEEVSKALSEGVILTDPETRFYLTYHLGTTQCYPLNLKELNDYGWGEKWKIQKNIFECLIYGDESLLRREEIQYIVVPKNPIYLNEQTIYQLKRFELDVQIFKEKINSVDWTQRGYKLIYEDEHVKLYEVTK